MSPFAKDNNIYFLHSADSRLWRFDPDSGNVSFFGGYDAADWRVFNRPPFAWSTVKQWEEFAGTTVIAIVRKKKRRSKKNVT